MAENKGNAFDWDDALNDDDEVQYVTLPEGDYPFEVIEASKGWFDGSDKVSPCGTLKLTIRVDGGELGRATVRHECKMLDKFKWDFNGFLRSVGLKKHGEEVKPRVAMDSVGMTGRCHITQTEGYKDKTKRFNSVQRWIDKSEAADNSSKADW